MSIMILVKYHGHIKYYFIIYIKKSPLPLQHHWCHYSLIIWYNKDLKNYEIEVLEMEGVF